MTGEPKNAWDALDLDRHGCIEASAGTGKTFTIENLVVRILTEPHGNPFNRMIDIEELLIVTYTEKATEELRYRIRRKLEEKLRDPSPSLSPPALTHIERCITRFDRAAIYTFHGFCNRFLTAHAFESRSQFGQRQADAEGLAAAVVADFIRKNLAARQWSDGEKLRHCLDNWDIDGVESFRAVLSAAIQSFGRHSGDALRPSLLSEKITHAFARLVGDFGAASQNHPFMLAWAGLKQTLGLKAAPSEKKGLLLRALITAPELDNADDILAHVTADPHLSSLLKKPAREHFLPVADKGSKNFRSFDEVVSVMGHFNGRSFATFIAALEDLRSLVLEHSQARNRTDFYDIIRRAQAALTDLKLKNGIRTFDDMIRSMHAALSGSDSQLLTLLRKRFRYGIIDEFQDTNSLQWDIFRKIFVDENDKRPLAEKNRLFVVGDPKQSVFSFQGSDVAVYLKAITQLTQAGAMQVPLDVNFRSTPGMVHACNALFSSGASGGDQDWFDAKASGIRYSEVRSAKTHGEVFCAPGVPEELKTPVSFFPLFPGDPRIADFGRKADKERLLAQRIFSLISYLTARKDGKTPLQLPCDEGPQAFRNCKLSDICVLVEKHREAQPIMKLLRQRAIPYTKQRNTGLFSSDECLHLLAVLDAVDRPSDRVAIQKALLSTFFGGHPSEFASDGATHDEQRRRDHIEIIRKCSRRAERRQWGTMFGELYKETLLFDILRKDSEGKLRIAAMRQLRSYCMRKLVDDRMSLSALVARLRSLNKGDIRETEDEDIFQKETEGDAVRILSMHSAKGLEFPIVIIASGKAAQPRTADCYMVRNGEGGTDFWFDKPTGKAAFSRQREQELRRLYYVALTRAKYRLMAPLWDRFDLQTGAIASEGKYKDASSASALFLSRACHDVLDKGKYAGLFSLLRADSLPASPSARAVAMPGHAEDAFEKNKLFIGEWHEFDGAYPANRMTVQRSYSGIVRLAHALAVRTDQGADEIHDEAEADTARSEETLEPSARTGNAIHDIFEQADFSAWANSRGVEEMLALGSASAKLIDECLTGQGLLPAGGRTSAVRTAAATIVRNSLLAKIPDPFGEGEMILGHCARHDRMAEAEFHFPFSRSGEPFPKSDSSLGGWVLGFIDLLFRHQGRYYLLDWKSNHIPAGGYGKEAIEKNMARHRYDVQYKVYSCALDKWLQRRLYGYEPRAHFGGVIYVYVRGTRQGQSSGIWTLRPTPDQLRNAWPGELSVLLSARNEAFA